MSKHTEEDVLRERVVELESQLVAERARHKRECEALIEVQAREAIRDADELNRLRTEVRTLTGERNALAGISDDVVEARDQRDEARVEVKRLKAEVDRYQEREAAVCPEDFSFEEVIKSLRSEVERLRLFETEALAARKFFDVSDIRKMGRLATEYLDARAANKEVKP